MKKQNRGITLIALVITIIILLILAGISISALTGSGLFEKTNEAKEKSENAEKLENSRLSDYESTINEYLAGTQEAITTVALTSKAQPGDYVEYIPSAKTFYMMSEQTGQDDIQYFDTSDYTGLWQVLYNDETNGLQIISARSVGTLTLGHEDSDGDSATTTTEDNNKVYIAYNNAVDTLNSFCKNYVDIAYAKDENSGRCVGSDPLNSEDTAETFTISSQYNTQGEMKVTDENYTTDYNAMKTATSNNINGISGIGTDYWLASRYVYSYENTDLTSGMDVYNFYVRNVDSSGNEGYRNLWSVWWDWSGDWIEINGQFYRPTISYSAPASVSIGIRPVITLSSDIQISDGDGSSENPYKLVAK